ncbi:MAG TPA: pyridoxamine 5'-phosphate oxidase family protein [Sedimentisphaerales bacterium]|nr:pyridoxamine 5'-phosphate oxidase family protein [Sedimentisphaerales bacterium]
MNLPDYFENVKGIGVLATSDSDGNVDIAIYSRPYIIDEKTIAFSMLERLSYANVQSNPKAAYLFVEEGEGYAGTRLYLTKTGEEKDPQRIKEIKQQHSKTHSSDETPKHLVYLTVDKIRPLVGDKPK